MIFKGKPTIDNLDFYLARREYDLALAAILQELKRRPDNSSLMLRQAEVLILMNDLDGAIEIYRQLAEHYTEQGFYARAIAVANKILRLDPERTGITNQVAQLISSHQAADRAAREKLSRVSHQAHGAANGGAGVARSAPPTGDEGAPRREGAAGIGDEAAETPAPAAETAAAPAAGAAEGQEERERRASQFFAAFPAAALEELLAVTSTRSFEAGDVIVREGEPGASLFLINEGRVDVATTDPTGRSVPLARLGPGDFFGEVSILTGKPRTATIVAREPVVVIEIAQQVLSRIIGEHPEVEEILRTFYRKRAQATVEALVARLRGREE